MQRIDIGKRASSHEGDSCLDDSGRHPPLGDNLKADCLQFKRLERDCLAWAETVVFSERMCGIQCRRAC